MHAAQAEGHDPLAALTRSSACLSGDAAGFCFAVSGENIREHLAARGGCRMNSLLRQGRTGIL